VNVPFAERVLAIVRAIPSGRVLPYGHVATLAGSPRAARAVGGVLRASLGDAHGIPWHRVLNARGGISFKGDTQRALLQRRLLEGEGVVFGSGGRLDMERYRWDAHDAPNYVALPFAEIDPPEDWEG